MTELADVVIGLVVAGQWPSFAAWDDARYPVFATDDPVNLLGKLF
jgi:hypothetical protein